ADETLRKYEKRTGTQGQAFEALTAAFGEAISQATADESRWPETAAKFRDLMQTIHEDPILSNVRRQVSYKGPDKWVEILEGWLKEAFLEVLRQDGRQKTLDLLNSIYYDPEIDGHLDREALKWLMSAVREAPEGEWMKPFDWGFHI